MNAQTERFTIDGPVGAIEIAIDRPAGAPRGIALVAHPHPLFGGTLDNKVAQTLARAMVQLGYATVRSNFRGVGKTEGEHDEGIGEREDLKTVIAWMRRQPGWESLPLALAGFSFGTFVLSHVAKDLAAAGTPAQRLVFVGTAASNWDVANVPADTLVIHGEKDETVPLQSVFDWARGQSLPVVVIPGGEHFFHGLLPLLRQIVVDAWRH
ncbi:alpha/beta hydrolase [Pandoraea terrae]|uniref:Alpha/beta hydrolase n=1 Tax=Pandoraea terrae TaxID=1537710 RepID=A0A5E4YDC9_9BURK|nr:CocE/NonD family hydrolase [Pandoraea terrae]VVE46749.1 alpha/beta hydrolase [Pandoraea terrae]